MKHSKTVIISGSSGLVGQYLSDFLKAKNYIIKPVSFSPNVKNSAGFTPDGKPDLAFWENAHAVVNLSGKSIVSLWTKNNMQDIVNSRISTTQRISGIISALAHPPNVFLSASAVGYYGTNNRICNEQSPKGSGFLADTCVKWEQSVNTPDNVRTCILRFGHVFGENGGMIGMLQKIFRYGLGAVYGDGHQYLSWISIIDLLSAIDRLLSDENISGVVNFTSPEPITNRRFSQLLSKKLNRPLLFRIPGPILGLMPNGMGKELFVGGIRAMPENLLSGKFSYTHPTFDKFLNSL